MGCISSEVHGRRSARAGVDDGMSMDTLKFMLVPCFGAFYAGVFHAPHGGAIMQWCDNALSGLAMHWRIVLFD